jgi:hypothetical protein
MSVASRALRTARTIVITPVSQSPGVPKQIDRVLFTLR